MSSCFCGENNCLKHFAFILQIFNDIMKVLPVLHYLMKFHKTQVLFKGRKLNIYALFACLT